MGKTKKAQSLPPQWVLDQMFSKDEMIQIMTTVSMHDPCVVLTENTRTLVGKLIAFFSSDDDPSPRPHETYTHAMWLYWDAIANAPRLASQDLTGLHSVPLKKYLSGDFRIKIWAFSFGNPQATGRWIHEQITLPWYKRLYDVLGIVGQLFELEWLQNPCRRFCSEWVMEGLKIMLGKNCPTVKRPSPIKLNVCLESEPGAQVIARYDKEIL